MGNMYPNCHKLIIGTDNHLFLYACDEVNELFCCLWAGGEERVAVELSISKCKINVFFVTSVQVAFSIRNSHVFCPRKCIMMSCKNRLGSTVHL